MDLGKLHGGSRCAAKCQTFIASIIISFGRQHIRYLLHPIDQKCNGMIIIIEFCIPHNHPRQRQNHRTTIRINLSPNNTHVIIESLAN